YGAAIPNGKCSKHFEKLAVDPSGNVFPCCSPGGFTAPLQMGNIHQTPLEQIVETARNNKMLAILESVGPHFFIPFIQEADAAPPLPDRFSDQCHACNVIMSEPAYLPAILRAS